MDRSDTTSFIGSLGFRAAREYRTRAETRILPEVRARWAHEFSNESRIIDASFTGSPGVSFRVSGDKPDSDRAIIWAGVTVLTKANLGFSIHYNADLGNDEKAHALMGLEW